jgi:hypothetical protein
MAEVNIDAVHCPGIDALARDRVGLVGKAQVDTVDLGQCAIQLGRGEAPLRGAIVAADATAPYLRLGNCE